MKTTSKCPPAAALADGDPGDGASPRRRMRDRSGFTILEVLVALAVLAVLAGLVPRSVVAARESIRRSEDWSHARLIAEQILVEELSGAVMRAGAHGGSRAGHRWTVLAVPNEVWSVADPELGRILLNIRVSVEVSGSETLRIDTVRIGSR